MPSSVDQRMRSLERANRIRLGGAAVKRDLAARRITLADALWLQEAQSVSIGSLLLALPRWGSHKTTRLLKDLHIFPSRRLSQLTERQKQMIVERAG